MTIPPYPDETNGLPPGNTYAEDHYRTGNHAGFVAWTDKRLVRITRLRLLGEAGFPMWDVSYCHGKLSDGRNCDVDLPFSQLPRRNTMAAIVAHAKRDNVYAKGLGIFDNISKLW